MGMTANLTGRYLEGGKMEKLSLRKMKISVCRRNKTWMVERLKAKTLLVSEVPQRVSWAKVWDASMNFGI